MFDRHSHGVCISLLTRLLPGASSVRAQISTSIAYMNFTLERPQNLSNSETFSFNIGEEYSKHSESQSNNLLDT